MLTERVVERIRYDAHDDVRFLNAEYMESLADRVRTWPQPFRHGAIHHRPPEFAHRGAIGFPKSTASNDGDIHRAEVLQADGSRFDAEGFDVLLSRQLDLRRETGAVEQHMTCDRRGNDPGHRVESVIDSPHECRTLRVVVAKHAEVKTDNSDMVGIEAEI